MTAIDDWLLDADPSIRWQVKRDLLDAAPDEVAAERALVATSGWGAAFLELQDPDGRWDGGVYRPGWVNEQRPFYDAWTATHFTLISLRELGAHPEAAPMRRALELVKKNVVWELDEGPAPYFAGETEPCINGMVLANAVYFGEDGTTVGERLLDDRLLDGGWNCFPDPARPVSSFSSTICVLEGLLAWQQAGGPAEKIAEARHTAEEYLLERRLIRRKSDDAIVDPRFTMLSYPGYWYYDILRALDYFRVASRVDGTGPDPRCADAIALLEAKRDASGRWRNENTHEGARLFAIERGENRPSRWSTLRALRVLRWWTGQ
ncbi:MAG TPA: hypothetical protein VF479_05270 [Pseudolysinimonas sp.]